MAIPKLGKTQWIFIGVFTAIATGAGWFWVKNSYPYLLENPIWQFNKPSDETIMQSLPSVRNIDYRSLRSLLEAKQWEKADRETGRLLAKASDLEIFMPMSREDILNFPCTDLTTIDRLWQKASLGRFGFNAQRLIVEREENLSNSGQSREICRQKCKSTIPGRCAETCLADDIWNFTTGIPDRMGRGDTKFLKQGLQLPEGYFPSWGIYWKTDFNNFLPYTYREFAKRSAMCGL